MTDVDIFLEHYGVKGMQWGVRRSQKQLSKAASKGNKKADKLTAKARKREAQIVKQKASVGERQKQLDRIASGKLQSKDILEVAAGTTYITVIGAAVNRQSIKKQYAQDQQNVLEGYKKGVARRETKTREMRTEARKARQGANEASRQLALIGNDKLP